MTGIELAVIGETAITLGDVALAAGTLAGAAGAISSGNAQKAAGEQQSRVMEYQARVREREALALEQNAGQERASAQRAAIEENRKADLVSSRAKAVGAASGAGSLDPTMVDILGGIETEGAYRAATALAQGEDRALGQEYSAVLSRAGAASDRYAGEYAKASGVAAQQRSYLQAGGTLAMGFSKFGSKLSSLYDKYSDASLSPEYRMFGYS
jgi:hypothetical protein